MAETEHTISERKSATISMTAPNALDHLAHCCIHAAFVNPWPTAQTHANPNGPINLLPNPNIDYLQAAHQFKATTPIDISHLRSELSSHPDQTFVSYLCEGLENGFDTVTAVTSSC